MSWRSREMVRQVIEQLANDARGLQRTITRTSSFRQAELQITNFHMLPVQTSPEGTDSTSPQAAGTAPLQVGRNLAFVEGYSAPPGTPAAAADATGRGGDTFLALRAAATGGGATTARMSILTPLTTDGSGSGRGTATMTIT